MTESEFKCMLSQKQYSLLLNKLKSNSSVKSFIQINYFYDSDDNSLFNNDITLRVRHKENNLQLQVKTPVKREGILSVKNEFSQDIKQLPLSIDLDKIDFCRELPYKGTVSIKGSLVTERTVYKICDGIEFDLDKNFYLGHADYELEAEFHVDKYDEAYRLLLELTGNEISSPEGGKRERFFSKLKAISTNL